jgi:hypothetical protein
VDARETLIRLVVAAEPSGAVSGESDESGSLLMRLNRELNKKSRRKGKGKGKKSKGKGKTKMKPAAAPALGAQEEDRASPRFGEPRAVGAVSVRPANPIFGVTASCPTPSVRRTSPTFSSPRLGSSRAGLDGGGRDLCVRSHLRGRRRDVGRRRRCLPA